MAELTDEQVRAIEWCLTLPASLAEATDFQAEEAIKLDMSIKLPDFYSLWEWIYETSNQWNLWSCTSMWTSHATQILNVKKKWTKPTVNNIITPDWKDLRSKMWHSTTVYDGWDYVERAVDIALKQWIKAKENWKEVSFDWYATQDWTKDDAWLELMKRYIYNWNPIVWCVRWNKKMWNEMVSWEIKTVPTQTTGWHCIAVVWFDKWGFWFINSWNPNDDKKRKCRFYVSNAIMKKLNFNYRYWVLYMKADAAKDPAYLKRLKYHQIIIETLKKNYNAEDFNTKQAIIMYSQAVRKSYPELNTLVPINQ